MTERITRTLKSWRAETIFSGLAAVLAAAGMFGAFVVLPYRMDAAEDRLEKVEAHNKELLNQVSELKAMTARIDERTANMARKSTP